MPRLNPFDMMRKISNTPGQTQQPTNTIQPAVAIKNGMQAVLAQNGKIQIPCWANLSERVVYPMTTDDAAKYFPNVKV